MVSPYGTRKSSPLSPQTENACSNEDPAQPKINFFFKEKMEQLKEKKNKEKVKECLLEKVNSAQFLRIWIQVHPVDIC